MKIFINGEKNTILLLLFSCGLIALDARIFNDLKYSGGMIFTLLFVTLVTFLDIEYSYYLTVFCFPFSGMLKFSASSISVIPIFYAIIILKLLIQKKQKIKVVPFNALILFAGIQILHVIVYSAPISQVISFILSCSFVFLSGSYFFDNSYCNKSLLKNAGIFLAVSVAINILLTDIFPGIPHILAAEKQSALELGNRFGALLVEPNELSQVILVTVGFLIATFSSYKNLFGKIAIVLLSVYLLVSGVRTYSKSYVLTLFGLLCLSVVLYVMHFLKKKHSAFSVIAFLGIVVTSIIAGYMVIYNVVLPVFEFRGETSDLLTGRDNIWTMYGEALLQRIDVVLIGCGAGNVTEVLRLVGTYDTAVSHNLYLEYIIQFGLIGIVLLFMSWREVFRSILLKTNWVWIPISAFLVTAFGISANSNDCIFIMLLLLSIPDRSETETSSIGKVSETNIE